MPPKKTTFSRITPAPRQTRLASRRSLPVTRRRDSPPVLQKRQSTLTQIDYIRSDGAIPNSSEEDEISEYEETQPKKKARLSGGMKAKGRTPGQSTLTQKWDWKAMAAARDSEESDGESNMLDVEETENEEDVDSKPKKPISKGHTQTQSELLLVAHIDSESDSEASTLHPRRVGLAASSDVDKLSTRPTTAYSTANPNPKTPRRPRRTEIPSSETPSSLKLSSHSTKQHEVFERSPLKDRSSNVPSVKRLRSPTVDKHGADSKKRALALDEIQNSTSQAAAWNATLAFTPRKDSAMGKRQLQRATTIQESDVSDLELELSPVQRKLRPVPSPAHPQAVQRRRRSLQRVTTIQDSEENSSDLIEPDNVGPEEPAPLERPAYQMSSTSDMNTAITVPIEEDTERGAPTFGPGELDSSPKRASQSTPPDLDNFQVCSAETPTQAAESHAIDARDFVDVYHDRAPAPELVAAGPALDELDDETDDDLNPRAHDSDDENDQDDDYFDAQAYPQTYDPVSAALDRDAARYGRDTQYESDVEYADDEESIVAATDTEMEGNDGMDAAEVVPSSQPGEARVRSSQTPGEVLATKCLPKDPAPAGDVDDSGYSSQHTSAKRNKIVLSVAENALPRPSQISTVVDDTQSPRSRPNSPHGWTQKSGPAWPETLSSSPFPLPPGFAMRSQRRAGETQSSGLIDFSLPPPPPLFLSSSKGEGE